MARWRRKQKIVEGNEESKTMTDENSRSMSGTNEASKSSVRATYPKMLEGPSMQNAECQTDIDKKRVSVDDKPNLDINLKQSPPDLNVTYEAANVSTPSLPMKRSFMEMESRALEFLGKSDSTNSPKLICKGCQACYMFVMVSEVDQRCPRCHKGNYLIEVCNEGRAKTRRLV